jgi:TRAP-type C4-dicarboxylate transport system permease small subunit
MNASDRRRTLDRLSEILFNVGGITCLALPVIILVVVIIRAINPSGMPLWSIDICELLMWFVTYLGLGYVWRLGRHVTVDVLIKNFSPRMRRRNDIVITLVLLVMSLIMMVGGIQVCLDSWINQKKTTNEFPEYFFSMAIPAGLAFFVYEVARSLWKKLSSPGSPIDQAPAGH